MPERSLHCLDAGALADEQARGRVPKIVGAERPRQARPPGGWLELAVQELPLAQWPAQRRSEHEVISAVRSPSQMLG
jgi:hypothetical protein